MAKRRAADLAENDAYEETEGLLYAPDIAKFYTPMALTGTINVYF